MNKSESIVKLTEALSAAQGEMPPVKFNATNPFLKNKYADLGAIIETAKPILAKWGLSVSQLTFSEGEQVGIETVLMHKSGEWLSSSMSMATEAEKGKSAAQVAGSIITYLRRYSLAAILGMYADEDGDGNAPKPQAKQDVIVVPEGAVKLVPVESEPTMTIEDAYKVTGSKGDLYYEQTTPALQKIMQALTKQLALNDLTDEAKAHAQHKLDAARLILKERANGSVK